jgi:hypothetical protein
MLRGEGDPAADGFLNIARRIVEQPVARRAPSITVTD